MSAAWNRKCAPHRLGLAKKSKAWMIGAALRRYAVAQALHAIAARIDSCQACDETFYRSLGQAVIVHAAALMSSKVAPTASPDLPPCDLTEDADQALLTQIRQDRPYDKTMLWLGETWIAVRKAERAQSRQKVEAALMQSRRETENKERF